jgi:DNA-binding SARP family transcriptional activator
MVSAQEILMSQLRISLFGKLTIQSDEQGAIKIEERRAQELLCYLLLYSDRLHEREKLATLLWSDKPAARSKQYLRQTLWQIQSALHASAQPPPLLLAEHDAIGIHPDADYWLDVAVFDQAFAGVEKIPGSGLDTQQVNSLQGSIQLYHGDLLEGWYEDWCIYERERRQRMYLAILAKLLAYSEAHQEYETGLAYGLQILQYDRAHERTHRDIMRLYYLSGNRTAALQQYSACVAALAEELDVGPAKSTIALYKQICADQVDALGYAPPVAPVEPEPLGAPAAVVQQHLEQIQATLTQLQNQIAHFVQTVEQNLADHT